ncbi:MULTISPECIES: hypothetical protein [unclassified Microcoleus]|uniref:hypothetical protein n=1 Tax=unclassified Microcoleus TaxID=2642155 RepID=UPI002FD2FAEA
MNEYTVIILFVAANPSKDISRGRKIILRKKEESGTAERRSPLSERSTNINITFKKCKCSQPANPDTISHFPSFNS